MDDVRSPKPSLMLKLKMPKRHISEEPELQTATQRPGRPVSAAPAPQTATARSTNQILRELDQKIANTRSRFSISREPEQQIATAKSKRRTSESLEQHITPRRSKLPTFEKLEQQIVTARSSKGKVSEMPEHQLATGRIRRQISEEPGQQIATRKSTRPAYDEPEPQRQAATKRCKRPISEEPESDQQTASGRPKRQCTLRRRTPTPAPVERSAARNATTRVSSKSAVDESAITSPIARGTRLQRQRRGTSLSSQTGQDPDERSTSWIDDSLVKGGAKYDLKDELKTLLDSYAGPLELDKERLQYYVEEMVDLAHPVSIENIATQLQYAHEFESYRMMAANTWAELSILKAEHQKQREEQQQQHEDHLRLLERQHNEQRRELRREMHALREDLANVGAIGMMPQLTAVEAASTSRTPKVPEIKPEAETPGERLPSSAQGAPVTTRNGVPGEEGLVAADASLRIPHFRAMIDAEMAKAEDGGDLLRSSVMEKLYRESLEDGRLMFVTSKVFAGTADAKESKEFRDNVSRIKREKQSRLKHSRCTIQ
ncbi:hypothetical protein BDV97DRAFT_166825 [Delphinella strobiligena]|nr:hypothetical protein BDV97DRAFT_166825 [Delphinella strobiligena]